MKKRESLKKQKETKLQYNPPISTADLSTFWYIDMFSNSGIFPSTSLLNKLAYIDLFFSPLRFIDMPLGEAHQRTVNTVNIICTNSPQDIRLSIISMHKDDTHLAQLR